MSVYRQLQNHIVFAAFNCLLFFQVQAQEAFSQATASQIIIESRHSLGALTPTSAQFSPDGKQVAITTDDPASLKIYDCDSKTEVFNIKGPYTDPQWSPDSRQLALAKDTLSVIIDVARRHVRTLPQKFEGKFWYWINKGNVMYTHAQKDTLILHTKDLQITHCPSDSALALLDSLPPLTSSHPNCYLSQASNKRWMVGNRNFSYWKALFEEPLPVDAHLVASPNLKYIFGTIPSQTEDAQAESWLYTLGVGTKPEQQFTTALFDSLDIIDQAHFRQFMGPGYLLGGVIEGDGIEKAIFRLDAFTATDLHLSVVEAYSPVRVGDSITQLRFYQRDPLGRFEIAGETTTPFTLILRDYQVKTGEVIAPMSYSYDPFALDSTGAPFFMTETLADSMLEKYVPTPAVPFLGESQAKVLNKEVVLQELIPFFNSHDVAENVVLRVLVNAKGSYKTHIVLKEVDPLYVKEIEKHLPKLRFAPAKAANPDRAIASWIDISFGFASEED